MVTTVTPPFLLKHSLASASTAADIMVRKYVDGLPLARQEKIWAREGVALSRATMANWVIRTAQTWLKPLYRTLKKELLGSSTIYADETVVQVLKEDGKAAVSESRMWVYAGSERSGQSVRYFEYQPNRSGKHAAAFLKGFHGCLVTDGYAGYNQVEGVTRSEQELRLLDKRSLQDAGVGRICGANGGKPCRPVRQRRIPRQQ